MIGKKTLKLHNDSDVLRIEYDTDHIKMAELATYCYRMIRKYKRLIPWFLIKSKGSIRLGLNDYAVTIIKGKDHLYISISLHSERAFEYKIDASASFFKDE